MADEEQAHAEAPPPQLDEPTEGAFNDSTTVDPSDSTAETTNPGGEEAPGEVGAPDAAAPTASPLEHPVAVESGPADVVDGASESTTPIADAAWEQELAEEAAKVREAVRRDMELRAQIEATEGNAAADDTPAAADDDVEQDAERAGSPARFVDDQDTWEEELAREAELARQAVRLEMAQPRFGFGSASRDQVNKVFVSNQHTLGIMYGTGSPGPARYQLPPSVGGKQPDGRKADPPNWVFGKAHRYSYGYGKSEPRPEPGQYKLHPSVGGKQPDSSRVSPTSCAREPADCGATPQILRMNHGTSMRSASLE